MRKVFLILLAVVFLFGGCGVKDEDAVLPENEKVVTESEDISFSGSEISESEKDVGYDSLLMPWQNSTYHESVSCI